MEWWVVVVTYMFGIRRMCLICVLRSVHCQHVPLVLFAADLHAPSIEKQHEASQHLQPSLQSTILFSRQPLRLLRNSLFPSNTLLNKAIEHQSKKHTGTAPAPAGVSAGFSPCFSTASPFGATCSPLCAVAEGTSSSSLGDVSSRSDPFSDEESDGR